MGWWGYNVFDGDSPMDCMSLVHDKFLDKSTQNNKYELESIILDQEKINNNDFPVKIYQKNLPKASKYILRYFKSKNDKEYKAFVAQCFMAIVIFCELKISPVLANECLAHFNYLYDDDIYSEINSFDEPKLRKKFLNIFKEKVENYTQNLLEAKNLKPKSTIKL